MIWNPLPKLRCESGACAQAREMAEDERISEGDFRRGLCDEHERLFSLLGAAQSVLKTMRIHGDMPLGTAAVRVTILGDLEVALERVLS